MMVARQSHLLIVEEEATLAEVTAFRLELLGFSVQVARNAEEAWTLLKQRKPDLVIIDLKLPGVGGVALIEQLASENETAMIPILALSFDAELDQVQRAAKAANITASVCGEMASEPLSVILLTGLGYDTLSVAPPSLTLVKSVVRSVPHAVAVEAARAALSASTAAEVEGLLEAAAAPYLRHR